ncbi:MAG: NAD(P)-binding domain-containing protein [Bacteroidia bacterium]|nr:NAD(P)-binding domain-containing protein [Bacteroidia bacterium]
MNIAIIGGGNVGGALAQGFRRAGHTVRIGAQFPLSEKSRKLAAVLGEDSFVLPETAMAEADAVVLATPPEAVVQMKDLLSRFARDKTVIDTTNSIRRRPEPHPTVLHYLKAECGLEQVVKCFNSTGFENMANPVYGGKGIDMFAAGSHAGAKAVAQQLAADLGFGACWDFGGDDKAELLEQFALAWINLAIMQGHGRGLALVVAKR